MTNKYSKTAINSIFTLVYTFFSKIFLFFFFFLKGRYNWYNSKKIDVPMLNRSKLYQDPYISFGTIGTILKLMLITNAYLSKFSTFTVCSLFTKCSKSKQYQRNKGRARMFLLYIFLFYESGSIQ